MASMECNFNQVSPMSRSGINIYDIREPCNRKINPLCYSIINDVESYLNQPNVQEILGVDLPFKGCNMNVNSEFQSNGDMMKSFVQYIPPLLESGIRVLVYAGDADYICNWMGNKAWTVDLDWKRGGEFKESGDLKWVSKETGREAGESRQVGGLAFLRVFGAGHMVPYDQPEHSLEFINSWITTGKGNDQLNF
jgi:cathepsin A (carboxypeptidase C)